MADSVVCASIKGSVNNSQSKRIAFQEVRLILICFLFAINPIMIDSYLDKYVHFSGGILVIQFTFVGIRAIKCFIVPFSFFLVLVILRF